ncbi:MAG: RagB/SusD family nutrient uptake outer membrane protein [Chitinophagaceae bacterium]|nr:RagB/SusD family nutrient uptake outer membrane protein [Chitinophagaceae bacterium]
MLKYIFFIIGCLAVLQGCKKDPDSIARNDVYNSGNYPKNMSQLFGVLVTPYSTLRRTAGLYGFEFRSHDLDCAEHTADLAYDGDPSWTAISNNNMEASNAYSKNVWSACYAGVQQVNTFFDRAEFFEKKYAKAGDAAEVNYMRGEAHFLRALYYFYLESLYGESYMQADGSGGDKMGVPIIASSITTLDSTQRKRSTVKETWAFIISELQQSASLLQGKVWDGSNQGRVTEWSAKALLGKVYVFTQDWANAKTTLLDVINNSGKSLMPFAKYRDAFISISANEFNEESLFEVNVDRDPKVGYGIFDPNTNLTSSEGLPLAPSYLGDDGTEANAVTTGYCNEFFHDKNLKRFGFNLPVWTLVNNPGYNSAQPESPSNPKMIIDPAYRLASVNLRINKTVDPRLYVNALQPWIDSGSNDGVTKRPIARCAAIPGNVRPNYYGWSFRKYNTFDNDIFNYHAADGANVYIIRLADVFLLYAEACLNSGDNANGLEYLNKVKRRAYDYPVNAPSPVDYTSATDNTSAVGDADLGNNPLYYERWAELMGEAHWWFDVCRWKIGKSEAAIYQSTLAGGAINFNEAKSYSWPIPSDEISANTAILQNPNY